MSLFGGLKEKETPAFNKFISHSQPIVCSFNRQKVHEPESSNCGDRFIPVRGNQNEIEL